MCDITPVERFDGNLIVEQKYSAAGQSIYCFLRMFLTRLFKQHL